MGIQSILGAETTRNNLSGEPIGTMQIVAPTSVWQAGGRQAADGRRAELTAGKSLSQLDNSYAQTAFFHKSWWRGKESNFPNVYSHPGLLTIAKGMCRSRNPGRLVPWNLTVKTGTVGSSTMTRIHYQEIHEFDKIILLSLVEPVGCYRSVGMMYPHLSLERDFRVYGH